MCPSICKEYISMHDYEFGKSIYVFSFNFCTLSGIIRDGIHDNFKCCFQIMNLGTRYFGPLVNTSRSKVLLIMLRSPVITWIAELYVNEELVHEQSGG